MWLIVGLGNPGRQYRLTRHNVGFRVVDYLSGVWAVPAVRKSLRAHWGRGFWEGKAVILAKPQTFMNLSGEAVRQLAGFFSIDEKEIIVIHDDLDLEMGRIKINEKGGDGGHKGIRSIIERLGSNEFLRLRLGIGRGNHEESEKDFVLSVFGDDQEQVVKEMIERAGEAVQAIIGEGVAAAMNRYNQKKPFIQQ